MMSPERNSSRKPLSPQELLQRLEGYFDGKFGEIDQEVDSFRRLGEGVRIQEGKIIRPELSIEALERVRAELSEVRDYLVGLLQNLSPELKTEAANEN